MLALKLFLLLFIQTTAYLGYQSPLSSGPAFVTVQNSVWLTGSTVASTNGTITRIEVFTDNTTDDVTLADYTGTLPVPGTVTLNVNTAGGLLNCSGCGSGMQWRGQSASGSIVAGQEHWCGVNSGSSLSGNYEPVGSAVSYNTSSTVTYVAGSMPSTMTTSAPYTLLGNNYYFGCRIVYTTSGGGGGAIPKTLLMMGVGRP